MDEPAGRVAGGGVFLSIGTFLAIQLMVIWLLLRATTKEQYFGATG
ncbi:MAG: hypothetical protein AAGF12_34290 [Myxococcota bacterium]